MSNAYVVRIMGKLEYLTYRTQLADAQTFAQNYIDSWIADQTNPSDYTLISTSDGLNYGAKRTVTISRPWIVGKNVNLTNTREQIDTCVCIDVVPQ